MQAKLVLALGVVLVLSNVVFLTMAVLGAAAMPVIVALALAVALPVVGVLAGSGRNPEFVFLGILLGVAFASLMFYVEVPYAAAGVAFALIGGALVRKGVRRLGAAYR